MIRFQRALQLWLKLKNYRSLPSCALKEWQAHLKIHDPKSKKCRETMLKADISDAFKFLDWQYKQGNAHCKLEFHPRKNLRGYPAIKYRMVELRSLYRFLIAQGIAETNPFEFIPREVPQEQDRNPHQHLDKAKIQALFQACEESNKPARNAAILAIMLGGALRRKEAASIRYCDLTWNGKCYEVQLHQTKDGSSPVQLISPYANDRIKRYLDSKLFISDALLFGLTKSAIGNIIMRLGWRAGIELRSHDIRTTAITELLLQGIPAEDIKAFTRHKTVDMVLAYDKRKNTLANSPAKKVKF